MKPNEIIPVDPMLPSGTPDAYVEALVRRAGTSFYWAMRRLEPARRKAVFAVYALCRDVDDIADGTLPLDQKVTLLNAWHDEIDQLFNGNASHPVTRALLEPAKAFNLQAADFHAVIDGMEMDAHPSVRIADLKELELYCDRVACAVGRLCVRVFGMPEGAGIDLAKSLGEALQLTNILRDVSEDFERDRVYLPNRQLAMNGVRLEKPEDLVGNGALSVVCLALAERARMRFDEADAIIAAADPKTVRPAVMMQEVYRRILDKLLNRGWVDLERDVNPTKFEKLAIAVRFGLFG